MFMIRSLASVAAALGLAACATTPLPDGSKVSRLPEGAVSAPPAPAMAPTAAPAMTLEERRRYDEIDRQVLREQDAARQSEQRAAEAQAQRRAVLPPEVYTYGYTWPYVGLGADWYWTGRRWGWRPRWGVGVHIWP